MRLDVVQVRAGGTCQRMQRTDLVQRLRVHLVGRDFHLVPPEALQVRQGRVCADGDAVFDAQCQRAPHRHGVAGVETASHVGGGDPRHHARVVAHAPCAERFAEVRVEVDAFAHCRNARR